MTDFRFPNEILYFKQNQNRNQNQNQNSQQNSTSEPSEEEKKSGSVLKVPKVLGKKRKLHQSDSDSQSPSQSLNEEHILSINPLSIRIFRSEVPIPDVKEATEHSLDSFTTDLLILSGENSDVVKQEFEACCVIFPQYQKYVSKGSLM